MTELNVQLHAEGQHTMIIGDRIALSNPTGKALDASVSRFANVVTSNDDGSIGYQMEGDAPRSRASSCMRIRAQLTNVHFYNPRSSSIPQEAYLGGHFDAVVRENAGKGVRPMMIADTVHKGTDNAMHRGLSMVMFGEVVDNSASIATRLPNGNAQLLVVMDDTVFTAAGLARLNGEVAKPSP